MFVNLNVVTLTSRYPKHHTTTLLATALTMLVTLRDADRRRTIAATGYLDSHANTNDLETITDPML